MTSTGIVQALKELLQIQRKSIRTGLTAGDEAQRGHIGGARGAASFDVLISPDRKLVLAPQRGDLILLGRQRLRAAAFKAGNRPSAFQNAVAFDSIDHQPD